MSSQVEQTVCFSLQPGHRIGLSLQNETRREARDFSVNGLTKDISRLVALGTRQYKAAVAASGDRGLFVNRQT